MTIEQLEKKLRQVNATRTSRQTHALFFQTHPMYIKELLEVLLKKDESLSSKAAWVLEYVCISDLGLLIQHLDQFIKNLDRIKTESSIRPVAKICELLVIHHYDISNEFGKSYLTSQHQDKIIAFCFDILIEEHKVAPKVFSMKALELLGKEHTWIRKELTDILERNFNKQSKGFKSRAQKILKRLKKIDQ